VKLLCRLYEPTESKITIDGIELASIDPVRWRERIAERSRTSSASNMSPSTLSASVTCRASTIGRRSASGSRGAGADDVVRRLPDGLDTQLGPTWHRGVEPSFGQWQKLALARGFMRNEPLLLVLDEPTAALDAETEFELFERYAAAARAPGGAAAGRVTALLSHRFSTVRMADLILVMDGASACRDPGASQPADPDVAIDLCRATKTQSPRWLVARRVTASSRIWSRSAIGTHRP
jgi:ATP-binding cassette subfamily B protein